MFRPIDALNVLSAKMTRNLSAIAKFLLYHVLITIPYYIYVPNFVEIRGQLLNSQRKKQLVYFSLTLYIISSLTLDRIDRCLDKNSWFSASIYF